MKKRTSARRYSRSRKKAVPESSSFSNQLSISIILTAFIFVISTAENPQTIEIRKKASALISRNALEDFKYQESIKDNLSEFIRCMVNTDDTSEKEIEKQITNDTESAVKIIPSEDDIPQEEEEPE